MKPTATTNHLITIAGGIGKNIMATAVIASLKHKKPENNIYIATAYPFVWENSPHVVEVFDINNSQNFFTKNMTDLSSWKIHAHDPYHTEDYLYRRASLINIWSTLLGVDAVTRIPGLYLSEEEKRDAKHKLPKDPRPIFLIQTNGGAPQQRFPISWARDLPLSTAEKVVTEMNKRGYQTLHIRRANQPPLKHTTWINASPREIMAMIPHSTKRLFIDSFPQHAAAALNMPSVVVWISNSPVVFGYDIHKNFTANIPHSFRHYADSYLERFDFTGAVEQCPFDTDQLFDAEKILEALLRN